MPALSAVVAEPASATGYVTYNVGDTGPGGGIIFETATAPGNTTGKYFEVILETSTGILCSASTTPVHGVDGLGNGYANTLALQGDPNCMGSSNIPYFFANFSSGGKSDWYLPNYSEMRALALSNAVSLNSASYWLSQTSAHSPATSPESYDGNTYVTAYSYTYSYTSAQGGNWPFFKIRSFSPVLASTTNDFPCGGGGTYTVTNGAITAVSPDCGGAVTLDDSVIKFSEDDTLVLPDSVTAITIDQNVTFIQAIFANGLESIHVSPSNANYMAEGGVLFNKAQTKLWTYPAAAPSQNYVLPASVNAVRSSAFSYNPFLENLTLNDQVNSIGGSYWVGIKNFIVPAGNQSFIAGTNGELLSHDGTELVLYPANRAGDTYTVPATVTSIRDSAINWTQNMRHIVLPPGLVSIGTYGLSFNTRLLDIHIPTNTVTLENYALNINPSLTSITVASDNPSFKSINGVLFSKDGTTLIQYPTGNSAIAYSIPNTVTTILTQAFWYEQNLRYLTIPSSMTSGTYDDLQYDEFYINFCGSDAVKNNIKTNFGTQNVICDSGPVIVSPAGNTSISLLSGQALNQDFLTVTSVAGLTVSASGTLPSGLTIDSDSGAIIGTTTSSGNFPNISITVTDRFGLSATVTGLRFTVSAPTNGGNNNGGGAPANPTPVITKDPDQTSSITSISQGCPTDANTVVIKGSFAATIANITINNRMIDKSQWKQSSTQVIITIPNSTSTTLEIQIFNGQVPVLPAQTITLSSACPTPTPTPTATPTPAASPTPTPSASPTPTPTPSASPTPTKMPALKTLTCMRGKTVKTVKGTNPKCPKGYTIKKK